MPFVASKYIHSVPSAHSSAQSNKLPSFVDCPLKKIPYLLSTNFLCVELSCFLEISFPNHSLAGIQFCVLSDCIPALCKTKTPNRVLVSLIFCRFSVYCLLFQLACVIGEDKVHKPCFFPQPKATCKNAFLILLIAVISIAFVSLLVPTFWVRLS